MDRIPLVNIQNGILFDGLEGNELSIDALFARVDKDSMLYVLDRDGIEHNKPNFDLYQRLTEHCVLWVDGGPRSLDDVMDIIMSGATNLTIRADRWPDVDIPGILDLTEDDVYVAMTSDQKDKTLLIPLPSSGVGIIVFTNDNQPEHDFTFSSYLKELAMKHKLYLYGTEINNPSGWEEQGLAGRVVDLRNIGGTA
jgi:hypothetical protein